MTSEARQGRPAASVLALASFFASSMRARSLRAPQICWRSFGLELATLQGLYLHGTVSGALNGNVIL